MSANASHSPRPRSCAVCGVALGRLDAAPSGICSSLACRTALATRALAARDQVRRENMRTAVAIFADHGAAVGVVPAFGRQVTPADPDRIALFRRSLTEAVAGAAAFAEADTQPEPDGTRDAFTGRALGSACGACGGFCCEPGGTHAFLTAEEVALQLARSPSLTGEELIAWYMARIPAESYEDSCVFQGEHGCVLDRPARARICNAYLCPGLHELAAELDAGPARAHVAAMAQGRVVRTVSLDRDAPAA